MRSAYFCTNVNEPRSKIVITATRLYDLDDSPSSSLSILWIFLVIKKEMQTRNTIYYAFFFVFLFYYCSLIQPCSKIITFRNLFHVNRILMRFSNLIFSQSILEHFLNYKILLLGVYFLLLTSCSFKFSLYIAQQKQK